MFCPRCGERLIRQEGELYCAQGDMYLSRHVEKVLTERYAAEAPPQSPEPAFSEPIHGGIRWHCPGCGAFLNSHLECEQCGKYLRDLMSSLVELHPHTHPS